MNLADPPPRVEAATAEKAPKVEAATTDPASPSERAHPEPAPFVEPAVTIDDPMKFAPRNVTNPETEPPKNLSVAALRGQNGADFESEAAVLRGPPVKNWWQKWCPFLSKHRNVVAYGEVVRFVLIKSGCCFVFTEKTDLSPLYAIPLEDVTAVVEDPRHPDSESVAISPLYPSNKPKDSMVTVLMKYHDGQQAYQFTFDTTKDRSIVKRFMDALQYCGKNRGPHPITSVSLNKGGGQVRPAKMS